MPNDTALVLRSCAPDLTSHSGTFKWPDSGPVECPDWSPVAICGNGLHGLLWGAGDASLMAFAEGTKYLAIRVLIDDVVDLVGKVKFPRGWVEKCGTLGDAVNYIRDNGAPINALMLGSTVSGGHGSTVSGGHGSTVSGGDWSTVSGGHGSTVSGDDWSIVSGGHWSTVSGEHGSTVSGGDGSTVSGGDWSTVSGGHRSTVIGGDRSTVSGGDWSTVSGGDRSTVIGGHGSTVSGGEGAILNVRYSDGSRWRIKTAYVGEGEIESNTPYGLNNRHEFEVVTHA